nr:MAG TPA: Inactive poly [Caudoviricetes sp.]
MYSILLFLAIICLVLLSIILALNIFSKVVKLYESYKASKIISKNEFQDAVRKMVESLK